MAMDRTERLPSTMHPRTDFLLRSPSLRGREQVVPFFNRSLTLPLVRIPCFMGKPCLSLPPVMRRTYPLNSSPRVSASTSWPILLVKGAHLQLIGNLDELLTS